MRLWRQSGFTLMELLIVVAILTLIAALMFPVFAKVRDAASRIRCLSNLRQLARGHMLYVQEYDETLPTWQILDRGGATTWTEFMRPYFRHPHLLDDRVTGAIERHQFTWLADYALCAWGPGGDGTHEKPYWRWPGAPASGPTGVYPMRLAEVKRPAETLQFTDGLTLRHDPRHANSLIRRRHRNGRLNGVSLDGHVWVISDQAWSRIDQDEQGYFYTLAAADR